jgi:sulfotransferase
MADKLYFVSGLPRSGSTLLMNLLGQNPNHYVTPTSGLIELFCNINTNWKNAIEFKSEGLEVVKPRVENAMCGILLGYFKKELMQGKICFDKSRGWLQYIEELEQVTKRPVKVVSTVRDIREILASFEKLYRKREIDYNYAVGDAFFQAQTVQGRCELLLAPGGVVGMTINRFRDALQRCSDKILVIPYKSFISDPKTVMSVLHDSLELPEFDYDTNNVKQVTNENDIWHGMDLHIIKPKIEPAEKSNSWEGILPPDYAANIAERFKDINELAAV